MSALIIISALGLDFIAGDPANRYHPTAWMGRLIARTATYVKTGRARSERAGGVVIVVVSCGAVLGALSSVYLALNLLLGGLAALVASAAVTAVLLKTTISVRGLETHARNIVAAIQDDDIATARSRLSMIVKRDTGSLGREHVISGAIESVSENTVDGVTGPLFYFGVLGLPGAFVYRVVNTADSMVGYRTSMFADLGWFAANCDRVLNYAPARITGLVMVLASAMLGMNWRGAYRVMMRDAGKPDSPNAGYPMAAAAGALGVRLEKIGHYSIGDGTVGLSTDGILQAVRLMKITSIVFCGAVAVPLMALLAYLGTLILELGAIVGILAPLMALPAYLGAVVHV